MFKVKSVKSLRLCYNSLVKNTQYIAGVLCVIAMFIVVANIAFVGSPQYAAAFFAQGKTVKEVVLKYDNAPKQNKVKILLVPGHEPDFGGAEYNGIIERDLNVALVNKIAELLKSNEKFEIIIARDFDNWNPDLKKYFDENLPAIEKWRNAQEGEMLSLVSQGKIELVNSVTHNTAPKGPALRLYGINKWANENKIDVTLHVHFNDNPKIKGKPKFSGFSIYAPEKQYSNATSSMEFANSLLKGLLSVNNISTMEQESLGVVEDQDLIAIGRYNTADSLVALVEYSYIYESKLKTKTLRNTFMDKMASTTASSLIDFFEAFKAKSF